MQQKLTVMLVIRIHDTTVGNSPHKDRLYAPRMLALCSSKYEDLLFMSFTY